MKLRAQLDQYVNKKFRLIRKQGNNEIIVQNSPDGHPASPENHNLRSLKTIRSSLEVYMGLSCHGSGIDPLITSVALGASSLEKSYVEDNSLLEQDIAIAENIADLPNALYCVASAWEMLGKPFCDPENATGLIATP